MSDSVQQRRSRGSTFAGFTEKIREKISASPQPLVLGDPSVRSEIAKEHQPKSVELDKGEFFDDVTQGKTAVQLKMNKAGITVLDKSTKQVIGSTFEWQYIADFRVGKNKKTFAIMHDSAKDGTKLERIEWKSVDTMRMLGTATKFVDVLAAEMREKAAKDAEAAAKAAEAPAPKKKKADKKEKKKSALGQVSHSPRGDDDDADAKKKSNDENNNNNNDNDKNDDDDDDKKDADDGEKKPRRKRGNTKKKSDADKSDDSGAAATAAAADATTGDGEQPTKQRRQRRGTKSKGDADAEVEEPLLETKEKKKKDKADKRARAQTTM